MNISDALLIGVAVLAVVSFALFRWLYVRSVRIKNNLRMNRVFNNITNEIVTPLSVLSASVEHLRQIAPDGSKEYDLMDASINRTLHLLDQILETSQSQKGELKLRVSNCDVMQLLQESSQSLLPLMKKKRLAFSIECHPESMMGWIDSDKIDKIVTNLLINSIKFTPEGGSITLNAVTNKSFDRLTIKIADTGVGVPKDRQKNMFTRLYDVDYRFDSGISVGISLAQTYELTVLHHGSIKCSSQEGQGTTFTIELPINKKAFSKQQIDEEHMETNVVHRAILDIGDTAAIELSADSKAEHLPSGASRILLVEDNSELLTLMTHLLRSAYRVKTAKSVEEAQNLIRSNLFDLIVSEVALPGTDGYELTKWLKHDYSYRHLPIILLSANNSDGVRQEALAVGADDCMVKPFKVGELRLRIDNIIANRQRVMRDAVVSGDDNADAEDGTNADSEFLRRAIVCVNDHLDDAAYDRDQFAADMGASASTLYNKLRLLTGMNVTAFIRDMRMKAACRLARENPDYRVSDIAYRVGYKDPKYFATTFKKCFGMQPKEYFQRVREEQ